MRLREGNIPGMVQAGTLAGMPEFFASELGRTKLKGVFEAAHLPMEIEVNPEHYIHWDQLMGFLDAGGRALGVESIGLKLSPHLTVEAWGTWGRYVTSAPTLSQAMHRMQSAILLHGRNERMTIGREGEFVVCRVHNSVAGAKLYQNVSYCTAGLLQNCVALYLGKDWRGGAIDLDVPSLRATSRIEQHLKSTVRLGQSGTACRVPVELWNAPRRSPQPDKHRSLFCDILRGRHTGPPRTLPDAIEETIRVQLLDEVVSLDRVARSLNMSRRHVQRVLSNEGQSFRDIARRTKVTRGKELLRETDASITDISVALGYASVAHFGRAFAAVTDQTPSAYREVANRTLSLTS